MKTVAIIQARMGSTRLPGKVMQDLAGEPMLARVVRRTARVLLLDDIIVATTDKLADNVITDLCDERGWRVFRGSEMDLLDRYYQAALETNAEVVVRITSDCPLIEPEIVERVVREFLKGQPHVDYLSSMLPKRTFPMGLDTEVMRFDALQRAWHEDKNPAWREHVAPYIHRNPDLFRLDGVMNDTDYSYMRWTVDTPEDLAFVRRIYDHFRNDSFTWQQVLKLLQANPQWLAINRHIKQKVLI